MDGTRTRSLADRVPLPIQRQCPAMAPRRSGSTIRAARGDDFEAVTALLELLGRATVTDTTREDARAVFRQQVVDPLCHHLVAVDAAGEVVAFCALHFRQRLNHATEEA